ncbi:MAG: ABC-F family ATP-binding cassette domain-containing protein [Armatimonadetes bacterium]|nr:ABC-F family ATP-binding cassette domain-containing protein [Armatimonadota bacterium]
MAVITLSNIKKSFGTRELFQGVSFFINDQERVALIGANGTGKTTLLRIICDEESADAGSVSKEPGNTIGYLPQEVDLPETAAMFLAVMGVTPELLACATELADIEKKMTHASEDQAHKLGSHYAEVSHQFDSLHGFDYQVRARAILLGLGFNELPRSKLTGYPSEHITSCFAASCEVSTLKENESEFNKPIHALSGGQKTRAALARLLLLSPDVLLLDEPTNHLDIQACEWLQEFLREKYNGAALIVSHDRYFLDQVVSKVIEIENGIVSTYKGNYSDFARQKAAAVEEQRRLYKQQKKEVARLEAAIQTLFSDRKFSRRDSKVKQLERVQRVGATRDQQTIKLSLSASVRSGREVVRLSKLAKGYPGKDLFSDVSFVAERGRKIGIVGPNGSGKTTLLRIIAERESADSGEVILGHNVVPVYFAQEFDHLVPTRSVIEELLADADINAQHARDLLAKFLFMGDDSFKRVEVLSGGELCRLALAKVLATSPNLLLLDEPTNHLDIASREALEGALRAFNGTILTASHDRYLLDAIADEIVEIRDGSFTTYLGNYSNYRENVTSVIESDSGNSARTGAQPEPPRTRPMSTLREIEKNIRALGKKRAELENNIHVTEDRLATLTEALGNEESYRDGSVRELTAEYDELSVRLESLYSEWEHVCEELGEMETELTR